MNFLSSNLRGVGDSNKANWIRGIKTSHCISFISIQETKVENIANLRLEKFWGWSRFDFEYVSSQGRSGGLFCLWDPGIFQKSDVLKDRNFLVIKGSLIGSGIGVNIMNVYAPCDASVRRSMWNVLLHILASSSDPWILMGDFNEVRHDGERLNSEFNVHNAHSFNEFILSADLHEYHMGGHKYTYMSDNGSRMSKLDRFLVSRSFLDLWPVPRLWLWVGSTPTIVLSFYP
jgi:hypothetical protein